MADQGAPSQSFPTVIPPQQVSFDREAFDRAVRAHGVRLVHHKALRCPVGMADLGDNRRPHPDHSGCSGGFLFFRAGTVSALFVGNSKQKNPADVGFWDGSTVQVTFPTHYDDGDQQVVVAPFDRFFLEEESVTVPMWQLFLHHQSGRDRLKYPAVAVEHLVDSRGEVYREGVDFQVSGGQLAWGGGRRPAPEVDLGPTSADRGAVCSVRYTYRPFWYVGRVLHEVRVAQVQDQLAGARTLVPMSQSVMLHREYVSLNKQQDPGEQGPGGGPPEDSEVLRQVLGAMNGGFGPR